MSDQHQHIEFELVQRAQSGDEKAFEELIIICDHQVLNVAYSMTGSLTDAQDIYQETFLRAFRCISSFRFQSSFRTWVLRIAVNQTINWRKKNRKLFLSLDPRKADQDTFQFIQIVDNSDPTASIQSEEILQHIHAGLNVLSAKESAVFTLRHFQGVKIKEIAQILNCADGTIKNLLFRATQKLRKELKHLIEE